jgi:DNA-binding NarL/FixJ family response regulator
VAALCELRPHLNVILMTDESNQQEEVSAILFGAKAYCRIDRDISLLPKIVKTVLADELWVDRKFVSRLLKEIDDIASLKRNETHHLDAGLAKLTRREQEIARWIAGGASNRVIAKELNISERTVKAHLGVIFRKLAIHDRLQLALYMNKHQQISAIWHSGGRTREKKS